MTYARRYALFAIVGIAGDDDLDAPDLNIEPIVDLSASLERHGKSRSSESAKPARGGAPNSTSPTPKASKTPPNTESDERLCERLIDEIVCLTTESEVTAWALTRYSAKATLPRVYAERVEVRFADYLARFVVDELLPTGESGGGQAERDEKIGEREPPNAPADKDAQDAMRLELGNATPMETPGETQPETPAETALSSSLSISEVVAERPGSRAVESGALPNGAQSELPARGPAVEGETARNDETFRNPVTAASSARPSRLPAPTETTPRPVKSSPMGPKSSCSSSPRRPKRSIAPSSNARPASASKARVASATPCSNGWAWCSTAASKTAGSLKPSFGLRVR